MTSVAISKSPRERVLATAMDLFYRQGYLATGINQIIEEAGVARASFYDHFRAKEDLLVVYAAETARREIGDLRSEILKMANPRDRFFGPMEILKPWLESTGFRGCPFQNVMAEAPPETGRVWEIARQHRESLRTFFKELTLDLKSSRPDHPTLDPDTVATTYLLLFEGAIALCVAYRATWPVDRAKSSLQSLLSLP